MNRRILRILAKGAIPAPTTALAAIRSSRHRKDASFAAKIVDFDKGLVEITLSDEVVYGIGCAANLHCN